MSAIPAHRLPADYPLQDKFFAECDGCKRPLQAADYTDTSQTPSRNLALHCMQCNTDICNLCVNEPTLCPDSHCDNALILKASSELFADMIWDNSEPVGQQIRLHCHGCQILLVTLAGADTREVGRQPNKNSGRQFIAEVLSNNKQPAMIWHCQRNHHNFCNSCFLQKRMVIQPVKCEAHQREGRLGWANENEYCFNCHRLLQVGEMASICPCEHERDTENKVIYGKAHLFDCRVGVTGSAHSGHSANAGAVGGAGSSVSAVIRAEANGHFKCQICYTNGVDIMFLPCRDAKACSECMDKLKQSTAVCYRCPFCNKEIQKIERIYF